MIERCLHTDLPPLGKSRGSAEVALRAMELLIRFGVDWKLTPAEVGLIIAATVPHCSHKSAFVRCNLCTLFFAQYSINLRISSVMLQKFTEKTQFPVLLIL